MNISLFKSIPRDVKVAFAIVITIAALSHGFGMFHYPYYEGDEGIYTSQAWSLVKEGTLSPYLYWYDHPPFGWITMAAWTALFGGNFFVFGDSSIDNMRVFMLLVHIISASFVFFITHRLSKKTTVAVVATLLFTLSPLFIYYQRRVLIDNVMTMWILLSYAMLLSRELTTKRIITSGIFFGFALLTKIPAIVFLPAFLYTLWLSDWPQAKMIESTVKSHIKRFTIWILAIFCVGMLFIGYTLAQGEFFPPSVTGKDHVSFISGIEFQLSRDSQEFFWEKGSYFRGALDDWLFKDRLSIFILTIGILIGFVAAWKNVVLRSLMAFVTVFLIFLMRGSIVTNFYILPLVPFAAMTTAMSFWWLAEKYIKQGNHWRTYVAGFSAVALIFAVVSSKNQYTEDETTNYKQAIIWVKENIDQEKTVMADMQGLVDLWDEDFINDKDFRQNADWFSKVVNDSVVRDVKLEGDYKNIDYILSSHELLRQMKNVPDDNIARQALLTSAPIKDWTKGAGHVDETNYSSSIGNWAKLYEVDKPEALMIEQAWRTYKQDYIQSYGQVLDPTGEITTSEGQGYGLLRAIVAHDAATFDGLWRWTRDQFQFRGDDKLLSSEWRQGSQTISDNNTFADATIAASLLLAAQEWDDTKGKDSYQEQALVMIQDLWRKSVVKVDGTHYMLATDKESDIHSQEHLVVNPSFLTPIWYQLFALYDTENQWEDLAHSSYDILQSNLDAQGRFLEASVLAVNRDTGELSPHTPSEELKAQKGLFFQGDPYKALYLAALEKQWFATPQAQEYIQKINENDLKSKADDYDATQDTTTSPLSAYIAYLAVSDADQLEQFYKENLESLYNAERKSWGQSDTYYGANWMWLGAAFFEGIISTPQI